MQEPEPASPPGSPSSSPPSGEVAGARRGGIQLAAYLTAFQLLIRRYTGDHEVPVEVRCRIGGSAEPHRLTLGCSWHDDPPAAAASERVSLTLSQALTAAGLSPDQLAGPVDCVWRNPAAEPAALASGNLCTLRLTLTPQGSTRGELLHGAALCAATTPALLDGHLRTLHAALTDLPHEPVSRLPLLTAQELGTILGDWSGPPHDPELARSELLHELFEAQTDAHAERVALWCEGRETTYAQVEAGANQLAHYLRRQGVQRGDLVAMWLPRSCDVYISLLAIMKAGAAYVPLDAEYPAERVAYILADARVRAVVTTSTLAAKIAPRTDGVLLDQHADAIGRESVQRLTRSETGTTPEDLCYVIYTSGSTGRPKGVAIEHRCACNLVRAETRMFRVQPEDRVYQGFSITFDASVEEVWLALAAGATLVVGTAQMVRAGAALAGLLTQARVTVLSCVPTLLAMIEQDLPSVRLLILGGEACPQDLVRRWAKPGRRMVNTYGPTEATVIATAADCDPGGAVTIGRPVPNYRAYILDQNLQPLPVGVPGELCLSGIGLARGYVGRPELTAEKFVANPFADSPYTARLYRTGDLVRYTLDGRIEFLGRIDSQVKLRGFRIELAEIESVLTEHPAVQAAAATVRQDASGLQQLVGYLVPRSGEAIDEDQLKTWLRTRLPVFMVPALLETVSEFPTLPSGKVDRKRLPAPQPRTPSSRKPREAPQTPWEARIVGVWEQLFAPTSVSPGDDFFLDLGGHSLVAATMVSQLRRLPEFHDLSVSDVYAFPSARALGAEFERRRQVVAATEPAPVERPRPSRRAAFFWCGLAQALGLYFILGFQSLQWITPYLTYCEMVSQGYSIALSLVTSLATLVLLYPIMLSIKIAIKWLVIGRYRAGSYPLWGLYYYRVWFVGHMLGTVPIDYLAGTPLLNWYYRLLGARIGKEVHFATDSVSGFDLLSIGDESSIGTEASLLGYTVEDGQLTIGAITVGQRCFVGARAMLRPGTQMEDDSRLGDLSLLSEGERVPSGQTWAGSPARPMPANVDPGGPPSRPSRVSPLVRFLHCVAYVVGVFAIPVVYLVPIFPGTMLMSWLARTYGSYWCLPAAPAVALVFVVLLCLEIAAFKWILLGRVKAGTYPIESGFYLRKWFVDQLMDISLDLLGPLYATLYLPPWYRLLGARMGQNAEVSTACSTCPDLLSLGDETFVADSVSLGVARVERGSITMAPTSIGRRAFVGNSAFVPAGTVIGDDTLLGVLSAPPWSTPGAAQPSTTWMGSPAIFLPQRQTSTQFDVAATYKPTRKLIRLRLFIEYFRITLPTTCFVVLTSLLITQLVELEDHFGLEWALLLFPGLYLLCGLAAALSVVVTKWLLVGRYRPAEKPLWSGFVWRSELVNAMHDHLAKPYLTDTLMGTPFLAWFLRALGVKVGRQVFLETSDFTEFDLVTIGDEAELNLNATIQTHLFEDRVMKMSSIEIGPRCTVGAGSVVLYDSKLEPGSTLGDLSLLMKGESLPAGTYWEGTPARLVPANRLSAAGYTRACQTHTPEQAGAQACACCGLPGPCRNARTRPDSATPPRDS